MEVKIKYEDLINALRTQRESALDEAARNAAIIASLKAEIATLKEKKDG